MKWYQLSLTSNISAKTSSNWTCRGCFGILMMSRFQNCHWKFNLTKNSMRKDGKRLVANWTAQTVCLQEHCVLLHTSDKRLCLMCFVQTIEFQNAQMNEWINVFENFCIDFLQTTFWYNTYAYSPVSQPGEKFTNFCWSFP